MPSAATSKRSRRKRSDPSQVGVVYLLHFTKPYKHARHYIGFAHEGMLDERLQRHRAGQGARLIAVIIAAGIDFVLARTWAADRNFERRLKNRNGCSRFCHICKNENPNPNP